MRILLLLLLSLNSFAATTWSDKVFHLPEWTTATRPICNSPTEPANGCVGFNLDIAEIEAYSTAAGWVSTGSSIADWSSSGFYTPGSMVINSRDLYRLATPIVNPPNDTFEEQLTAGNWERISPTPITSSILDASGGIVTGIGTLSLNITAGEGIIVNTTSVFETIYTRVPWVTTNITPPLGANKTFFITVDIAGAVKVETGSENETDLKTKIILARGITDDNGLIYQIDRVAWNEGQTDSKLQNLIVKIGKMKFKNEVYSPPGTLNLGRVAGEWYYMGANPGDRITPNSVTNSANSLLNITYSTPQSLGVAGSTVQEVDPNFYQPDGTGPLVPVTADNFTIQPFWLNTKGDIWIQYGQKEYTSFLAAQEAVGLPISINPALEDPAIFFPSGYLIVKQVMTNFDDPSQSSIFNSGRFGAGFSASSGQGAVSGDVFGPASSNVDEIATFSSSSGKAIKNSSAVIDSQGNLISQGNLTANDTYVGKNPLDNTSSWFINNALIANPTGFALSQNNLGTTTLNAAAGRQVQFGINGVVNNSIDSTNRFNFGTGPIIGTTGATYTLPSARGANGQILSLSPAFDLQWITAPRGVPDDGGNAGRILTSDGSNAPFWNAPGPISSILTQASATTIGWLAPGTTGQFLSQINPTTVEWVSIPPSLPDDAAIPNKVLLSGGTGSDKWLDPAPLTGQVLTQTAANTVAWETPASGITTPATTGVNRPALWGDTTGDTLIEAGYTVPDSAGTDGQVLQMDATGNAVWGTLVSGGDVVGPNLSTADNLVSFNGASGKLIKDSGVLATNLVTQTASSSAANHLKLSNGLDRALKDSGYTVPSVVCPNGEILKSDGTNLVCSTSTTVTVIDNLLSTSSTSALSANQGFILDSRIDPLEANTHTHTNKVLLDSLTNLGAATQFLSADGTYRTPVDNVGTGDVVGPATSTLNTVSLYADTTGKVIKGTTYTIPTTSCANGEVLKSNGTNFTCQPDAGSTDALTKATAFTAADRIVLSNAADRTTKETGYTLPTAPPMQYQILKAISGTSLGWADDDDSVTVVEDVLTSTSTANALSANQGRVLEGKKVDGPATSANDNIALFNGTTGKLIKDSALPLGEVVTTKTGFSNTNRVVLSNTTPGNVVTETGYTVPPTICPTDEILKSDGTNFYCSVDSSATGANLLGVVTAGVGCVSPAPPTGGYSSNDVYLVNGSGSLCPPFTTGTPSVATADAGDWLVYEEATVGWSRVDMVNAGTLSGPPSAVVNQLAQFDSTTGTTVYATDYSVPHTSGTLGQVLAMTATDTVGWQAVGDVTGPAGGVIDNEVAVYSFATGKIIKSSSGLLHTDIVTKATNFSGANKVALAGGANKTLAETGYTIPLIVCSNGQVLKSDGTNMICGADVDTSVTVIDDLTSTSATSALSANQGKVLQDTKVAGPVSSIDSRVTSFDGSSGKLIKDSGILTADIVTKSSDFSAANRVVVAGGADRTLAETAYTLPLGSCPANQILKSNGVNFICQPDFGGTGDIVGPATSATNTLAQYADATGKLLKGTPYSMPTVLGTDGQILKLTNTNELVWADESPGVTSYTFEALYNEGYSANNTTSIYFKDIVAGSDISTSTCGEIINDSVDGFGIRMTSDAFVLGTIQAPVGTGSYSLGFVKNPTAAELDMGIESIPPEKIECSTFIMGFADNKLDCTFSAALKPADTIYLISSSGATWSNNDKFKVSLNCITAIPLSTGGGNLTGPVSSSDNALVRWDGITGVIVQDSNVTLSDTGLLDMGTSGDIEINGTRHIEFGSDEAGKAPFAGFITYGGRTADTLDISGAGGVPGDLVIKLWDDVIINDALNVTGLLTASGNTYPANTGTSGQVLTTDGAGNPSWQDAATTIVTPATTTEYQVALFDNTSGDGLINTPYTFPITDGTSGQIPTTDGLGAVTWQDPAPTIITPTPTTQYQVALFNNITGDELINTPYAFPIADGASGQVPTTNGAGTVSWNTQMANVGTWQTGQVYPAGRLVRQNNDFYVSTFTHTSGNFQVDLLAGNLEYLSPNNLLSGFTTSPSVTKTSATSIDTSAFIGVITNYWDFPGEIKVNRVDCSATTLTAPATPNTPYYITCDINGVVSLGTGQPSSSILKEEILMGMGVTDGNAELYSPATIAWKSGLAEAMLQDYIFTFGLLAKGFSINASAGTMEFVTTAGLLAGLGINPSNAKNPNEAAFSAKSPTSFVYATATSLGDQSAILSSLNPNIYDPDGLGVVTAVPAGQFTIQLTYIGLGGDVIIKLGQKAYPTMAEASAAVFSERIVSNPILSASNLFNNYGYIVLQEGATDSDNAAEVAFYPCELLSCGIITVPQTTALSGDVFGPASSSVNNMAVFADSTGKTIKDSGISYTDLVSNPTTSTSNNLAVFADASGKVLKDSGAAYTSLVSNSGASTDNAVCRFDAATGKIIQNSGISISDTGDLALSNTGKVTMGSGIGDKINLFGTTYGLGISTNTLNYYTPGNHVFRTGGNNDTGTARMTVATTGVTVANALGVTGATTLSSTLGVTGAATLNSTLGVTGATNFTGTASTTASFNVNENVGVTPNTGGLFLNDTGNAVGRYTPGVHFGNGGVYHSRLVVRQDDANGDDNGALEFWSNAGGFSNRMTFNINYNEAWFYNIVSAVSYATRSDRRLKEDIKDLDLSKDFISKVRPVTFKWKDRDDKSLKVGLIAQEVKEILPSAVGEDEEGNLTIDYGQVIVALINVVKNQEERIKVLEGKLK